MLKKVDPNPDFPLLEREILSRWYKEGIVDLYLNKNKASRKKFSFLDGPITANNPMGVHHAWGRTYKDLWQRFFNMRGYKQRFQNGFDEQGLWVEVEVEKELGLKNKKDIENLVPGDKFKSLEKFINLCKERVKKYSEIQTEQSKRLGYFMDWNNSYHTSSDNNNYSIWNFLKIVHEKGWLYKGRDSVPWCPRCGTAISQHEILTEEYKNITHESIYFKLPVKAQEGVFMLVWTTTPWTIPGNVAVAVNLEYDYVEALVNGEKLILLKDKIKDLLGTVDTGKTYKGSDLVGWKYEAPFDHLPRIKNSLGDYSHRVAAGDDRILPVGKEEGTGLVHVAPGAGAEDFQLGKKEKLPVIDIIGEAADYLDELGELSGKNAKKHPELIIEYIKTKDNGKFILKTEKYTHRYPTCWRCKSELVWRVVEEWYIAMDKPDQSGKTYREQMMEVSKKIKWLPEWGLDRELDWLKNMNDWLISKKRYWGLALPIWVCEECSRFQVIGGYDELKEKAIEGWERFEGNSPHKPWIDQVKIKCNECNGSAGRIPDVGNPWLDAGIVPFSTLPDEWYPADFITESFPGQFKNWFYSLIAMSTALTFSNPFKTVLGFASVRDEKGEEMHKSKGNAIEFNEAADKIGVDVTRWMYTRQDPEQNLNFGYTSANQVKRSFHLMLWNVYNYFVTYAILNNYKTQSDLQLKPVNILDKWICSKLHKLIMEVENDLLSYQASSSSLKIEKFLSDLSTWYIRRSRERAAVSNTNNKDKKEFFDTTYFILVSLSKLLAPFIPFISEEIYTNLIGGKSVHLSDWPGADKDMVDENLEKQMFLVRKIVELAHARRKEKQIKVRQPLAKITVKGNDQSYNIYDLSDDLKTLIADEVNVKEVLLKMDKNTNLNIELDLNISPELKDEGEAREIIRKIQDERKKIGTTLHETVDVYLENWPERYEEYIKRKTLTRKISKSESFSVRKISINK